MKKTLMMALALLLTISLGACQDANADDGRPVVITTLYPQYDFTRRISDDSVNVQYLLPPGISAHAYDPSPQDVIDILEADLFIYTGETMEPWVESTILPSAKKQDVEILNLSNHVELIAKDHDHEAIHEEDAEADDVDPHIWTDPLNAVLMVEAIETALAEIVGSDARESLASNTDAYISRLQAYHADVQHVLDQAEHDVIMHGGHNAFGYFIHRYGLEYVTPYEGFSTDSEPTPGAIADMVDTMDAHGVDHLFAETLIDPRVAEAIGEETGADILYLHTAGNVSKDAFERDVSYLDMMRDNLSALKEGLNYHGE